MNARERLRAALTGVGVDRPPVVCLGGPMSAAVSGVLAAAGIDFAAAHRGGPALARAAVAIARVTGFENVGLPLCATVEAEALGSAVAPGGATVEPRVARERHAAIDAIGAIDVEAALASGRVPALLEAVATASEEAPELPVVVNLLGQVTLAGGLLEPTALLRAMIASPAKVHALLERLDLFLATLAGRLAAAGADALVLHEDMGDPRSVGPAHFEAFTVHHLAATVAALRGGATPGAAVGARPCGCAACRVGDALEVRGRGVPAVVHCCELNEASWPLLPRVGVSAWSVGAATAIGALRRAVPELVVLGNVSTHVLDRGAPDAIRGHARRALRAGVDVLAPACGLAMSTPLASIHALTAEGGARVDDE